MKGGGNQPFHNPGYILNKYKIDYKQYKYYCSNIR